jgi:hypothetical protein
MSHHCYETEMTKPTKGVPSPVHASAIGVTLLNDIGGFSRIRLILNERRGRRSSTLLTLEVNLSQRSLCVSLRLLPTRLLTSARRSASCWLPRRPSCSGATPDSRSGSTGSTRRKLVREAAACPSLRLIELSIKNYVLKRILLKAPSMV